MTIRKTSVERDSKVNQRTAVRAVHLYGLAIRLGLYWSRFVGGGTKTALGLGGMRATEEAAASLEAFPPIARIRRAGVDELVTRTTSRSISRFSTTTTSSDVDDLLVRLDAFVDAHSDAHYSTVGRENRRPRRAVSM